MDLSPRGGLGILVIVAMVAVSAIGHFWLETIYGELE